MPWLPAVFLPGQRQIGLPSPLSCIYSARAPIAEPKPNRPIVPHPLPTLPAIGAAPLLKDGKEILLVAGSVKGFPRFVDVRSIQPAVGRPAGGWGGRTRAGQVALAAHVFTTREISMPDRTILISGASIAGPALAYWLHRHGMTPIVVERADAIRPGGQTVDVRGAGRTVVRRMGIEEAVRDASTGEKGVAFVDRDNTTKAAFGADLFDGDGPVAELEILRGQFAELLYDQTRDHTEYVFGDHITALRDTGESVHVTFEHGPAREVDLVVAADGIRSATRSLIFGSEARIRPLGVYIAYFTIPRGSTDGDWARWYNAPGGLTVTLRPDNVGTTRALLSFRSGPAGYENLGIEEQKAVLRAKFAHAGWETPRVLAGLGDSPDFYFELIGQVHAPRWSRGRTALLGDAGYCPSPISGMGTSLALVGAYVLAGELATHADHREAFASYETVLRPYVTAAQRLPPLVARVAFPRTKAGIRVLYSVLRVASGPRVQRLASRLRPPPTDDIELPDYATAAR